MTPNQQKFWDILSKYPLERTCATCRWSNENGMHGCGDRRAEAGAAGPYCYNYKYWKWEGLDW